MIYIVYRCLYTVTNKLMFYKSNQGNQNYKGNIRNQRDKGEESAHKNTHTHIKIIIKTKVILKY